jgi:thiol:disulfide interchange protein
LRWGGYQLGWGFQLQSPWVVAGLAVLLAGLGLHTAGVGVGWWPGRWSSWSSLKSWSRVIGLNRLSTFLQNRVSPLISDSPTFSLPQFGQAMGAGILTVVLASPCIGPFLGASLGWALLAPGIEGLAILMALGLGLALPYGVLALNTRWLGWLPSPGPWMKVLKKGLAIPLLLTSAWLACVWWQEVYSTPSSARHTYTQSQSQSLDWQPWKPGQAETWQAQGSPVLVDFTAAWCLTCRYNELTTLQEPSVVRRLREGHVRLLKADWTRADPAITQALHRLGRSGIPVYAVYPNRAGAAPILLSEWLRVAKLHEALDRASVPGLR